MAVTKHTARQHVLAAVIPITSANSGAGNEVTVALPPGAHITQLLLVTHTVFNSATTATISDGTNTLVSAEDMTTLGSEAVDLSVTMRYPNGGTLTISLSGTATAGAATVILTYVDVDRQDEHYKV